MADIDTGVSISKLDLNRVLPHILATLLFIGIAAGWAFYSWNTGVEHIRQSDTTGVYFAVVMQYKHEREAIPSNQQTDWRWGSLLKEVMSDQKALFASTDVKSLYQASFNRYLGTVYRVTGDVTLGYKILVFPLNLLFLLGAYALFLHLTGKVLLATLLAVLASFPIAIPIAGEFFGMGPVTIYSRRNLFTAFAPIAIFLFYRWIHKPYLLLLVFAFVGLISNLHASGVLLAEILVLTYFIYNYKKSTSWGYAALFGLIAIIFGFMSVGGLWSRVASYLSGLAGSAAPKEHVTISGFLGKQGIPDELDFLFYPLRIYSHLPLELLHVMTVIVITLSFWAVLLKQREDSHGKNVLLFLSGVAALAYLGFSEFGYFLLVGIAAFSFTWKQGIDRKFELTHYLILAIFFVSFAGMLLFQVGYHVIKSFPLVFDQLRGARFLGLMVFAWLAVLLSRIDWSTSGKWGRRTLVACIIIALLMTVRQDFRSWIRYKEDPDSAALLDLARWCKDNTPNNAAFLVVSTRFGIVAERNVLLHDRESRMIHRQKLLERTHGGLPELRQLAREEGMSYIVVKTDQSMFPTGENPVYGNQRYALIKVD